MIEKEFETFAKNRSFVNLEKPQEPDVKTKYLSLPYLNDKSEKIAFKLNIVVKVTMECQCEYVQLEWKNI